MGHPLALDQHRALVAELAQPLTAVRRPLRLVLPPGAAGTLHTPGPTSECLGTVLAEPVIARLPVPPFTNSAMDGFAVRHLDIAGATGQQPIELPTAGDIPAGDTTPHALVPGTAWRIMTGAPIPDGADTVVRVEDTDHQPGVAGLPPRVRILRSPDPGANIRRVGENLAVGAFVLPAGTLLDAAALAAAVSAGHGELLVHPRPRVGIITTGNELVVPGLPLLPGQIPDSNALLLAGLISAAGADLVVHDRTGDDPRELRARLADWPEVDLVITAGGISAGAYEVVRLALDDPDMRFHHVAQQPGGPQGVGLVEVAGRRVPALCLPGNPVSVFVSFHVHAAGLIAVLAGRARTTEPRQELVRAGQDWASPLAKTQFIPVTRQPDGRVMPVHRLGSGSHLVASLPRADGLAVVPVGVGAVRAGDRLAFIATRNLSGSRPHPGDRQDATTGPDDQPHAGAPADPRSLPHLDAAGAACMVDVTAKQPTVRQATARARVDCSPTVLQALRSGSIPKGDVLAVARIAGIQAAKRTPELLPLAHVIGVHGCAVDLQIESDHVSVLATVRTADRTGVEMEALTAATVAALAVVDMVKGVDRTVVIREALVVTKSGGRSGEWSRPAS